MKSLSKSYADIYGDRLNRDGVVVLRDIDSLPLQSDSYFTSCLMIALHTNGRLRLQYDMIDREFADKKAVILLPNHMIGRYWASEDFKRTLIIVSPQLMEGLTQFSTFKNHIFYHQHPECELTEEQKQSLVPAIDLLETLAQSSFENKKDMVLHLINTILNMLNEYNIQNTECSLSDQSNRLLFSRFYDNLIAHYDQWHDVKQYAAAQCLTPKYFAKLIQQASGIRAADWIDNYIIMKSKNLLRNIERLTIQQISNQLGFTEQSVFCRFFKNKTGISPTTFRKTIFDTCPRT